MGVTAGPADWWVASPEAIDSLAIGCPVATTLPDDSRIICKAGGKAWIIAPCYTEVIERWGNYTACGAIDNMGSVFCDITSTNFPVLYNRLISCGFNPSDWFVPCFQLLQNPGYVCRTNWDSVYTLTAYWSSTEFDATQAYCVRFSLGDGGPAGSKVSCFPVRAFRCVTY